MENIKGIQLSDIFLTIVIVTYKRDRQLRSLLSSLACQTDLGFNVIVIHDGPSLGTEELVMNFNGAFNGTIKFLETNSRHNDYGHTLRELGISLTETEFLLLTNDDNYYVPILVQELRKALSKSKAKLVLLDLVHSYPDIYTSRFHLHWIRFLDKLKKYHLIIKLGRKGPYSAVRVKPSRGMIDIGSMVIFSSLAKEIGFPWRDYDADGKLAEALVERIHSKEIIKLPGLLFIHN